MSVSVDCVGRLCLSRHYGYHATVTTIVGKLYCTVNKGIQSVIATHAYILAGIVNCAPLAYYDVAGYASLTTTNLYA